MPFYLSLSTLLMSASFLAYGIFNNDPFVYVSLLPLSIYFSSAPFVLHKIFTYVLHRFGCIICNAFVHAVICTLPYNI